MSPEKFEKLKEQLAKKREDFIKRLNETRSARAWELAKRDAEPPRLELTPPGAKRASPSEATYKRYLQNLEIADRKTVADKDIQRAGIIENAKQEPTQQFNEQAAPNPTQKFNLQAHREAARQRALEQARGERDNSNTRGRSRDE